MGIKGARDGEMGCGVLVVGSEVGCKKSGLVSGIRLGLWWTHFGGVNWGSESMECRLKSVKMA